MGLIKPGSLIDRWVAWIRISDGVRILLISPVDQKWMTQVGRPLSGSGAAQLHGGVHGLVGAVQSGGFGA
jgi:hypothetical protein